MNIFINIYTYKKNGKVYFVINYCLFSSYTIISYNYNNNCFVKIHRYVFYLSILDFFKSKYKVNRSYWIIITVPSITADNTAYSSTV